VASVEETKFGRPASGLPCARRGRGNHFPLRTLKGKGKREKNKGQEIACGWKKKGRQFENGS